MLNELFVVIIVHHGNNPRDYLLFGFFLFLLVGIFINIKANVINIINKY